MGFFSRLFGPREPESFAPASEKSKQAIMLLGMSCDYDGLAKNLKSKNPHVRAFTVEAVLFAGRTRGLGGNELQFRQDTALDARAVQLLIPLLKDDDQKVRTAAANGLESAGHDASAARALEKYRANFAASK